MYTYCDDVLDCAGRCGSLIVRQYCAFAAVVIGDTNAKISIFPILAYRYLELVSVCNDTSRDMSRAPHGHFLCM